MSAFICSPNHIATVAAYYTRDELTAVHAAETLMKENIRSVACRYPDDVDGDRPGPTGMTDAELVTAAKSQAAIYVKTSAAGEHAPVEILKLLDCLEYQSCETSDYKESDAYDTLSMIRSRTIGNLPGYDQAPWEI